MACDSEKVIVSYAASYKDEIRFYINDTQYFTAFEDEENGGITSNFGEDEDGNDTQVKKRYSSKKLLENVFPIICMMIIVCNIVDNVYYNICGNDGNN